MGTDYDLMTLSVDQGFAEVGQSHLKTFTMQINEINGTDFESGRNRCVFNEALLASIVLPQKFRSPERAIKCIF